MAGAADYLTCGLCQTEFPLAHIMAFIQHKKYDCDTAGASDGLLQEVEKLHKYSCVSCPEKFAAAVTLLQHVQLRHQIKIFMEEVYNSRTEAVLGSASHALVHSGKSVPSDGRLEHIAAAAVTSPVSLALSAPSATASSAAAVGTSVRKMESDLVAASPVANTPLNRCCASVVPKKRKRHIELKHSYVGASSSSGGAAAAKARRRSLSSSLAAVQHRENTDDDDGDTIYIDVNPSGSPPPPSDRNKSPADGQQQQQNPSAVILQPGNTYSISSSSALPYVGITYGNRQTTSAGYAGNATVSTSCSPSSQTSAKSDSAVEASYRQQQRLKVDALEGSDSSSHADASSSSCTAVRRETLSRSSGTRKEQQQQQRDDLARPFKCDQCEHSFNQRIHLQKHLSKHTGVKPYKCQQCDYATVERSHLKVHIRIHTGEKPFKCTYCEYATAQNSTLKIHLKRHHGGFMLECSHCGKSFPEKNQFNAHQREHGAPEDAKVAGLLPTVATATVAADAGEKCRSPLASKVVPAASTTAEQPTSDLKPASAGGGGGLA